MKGIGWRQNRTLFDDVCSVDNLTRAWVSVRAAHGAAGIDRVSVADFEAHWVANIADLARALREETYLPLPAPRVALSKPGGGARTIGLLAVQDRLVQRAVHNVVAPLFERRFLPCSYGYRPGRNTAQAVAAVLAGRNAGYVWAVDADIAAFFDALDHQLLLREVVGVVGDRKVVRLIALWLDAGLLDPAAPPPPAVPSAAPRVWMRAGIDYATRWSIARLGAAPLAAIEDDDPTDPRVEGLRRAASGLALVALSSSGDAYQVARRLTAGHDRWRLAAAGGVAAGLAAAGLALRRRDAGERSIGTLQGAVLSPLLANAYLHPLDVALRRRYPHVVRYADNVLVLCRSRDEAQEALDCLRATLADLRLALNEEKTLLRHIDAPFVFLGYRIADGEAVPVAPTHAVKPAHARALALGEVVHDRSRHFVGLAHDRARHIVDPVRDRVDGVVRLVPERRRIGVGNKGVG